MLFSPQIPLQLTPLRDSRFDNFVNGPNSAVTKALNHMPDEPGSVVFLSGSEGSGKTHLLNALCVESRERHGRAFYLALKRLPKDAIVAVLVRDDNIMIATGETTLQVGDRMLVFAKQTVADKVESIFNP